MRRMGVWRESRVERECVFLHLVHRRQRVNASSPSLICFRDQSGREDTAPQCAVYLVCVCMRMWRDG